MKLLSVILLFVFSFATAQNGFEITDRIQVLYRGDEPIRNAVESNFNYICAEILANKLEFSNELTNKERVEINEKEIYIGIEKANG